MTLSNAAVPWLAIGATVGLVIVKIDWKEFHEKGVEGPGFKLAITASGEKTFSDGTNVKITGTASATLSPEWTEIGKAILKKAAEEGVSTTVETAVETVAETGTATTTAVAGEGAIALDVAGPLPPLRR